MGELSAAVVGLIDGLRAVLSGLPANPVSEFLSGALYLVRRSLRPVGAGVGLFGSVPCVGSGDCSGLDLSGADLSGRILAGLNFARAVLNGVDFSGADLSRADLGLAALRQADLTDANLFEANLAGADLVGADLDGVTNFATATLTGADLSGQILLRLDLSDKDLTDTDFSGAILTGSDLSGADLGQADFEGAGLAGVDLSGVDLSGADLNFADLGGVIWGDTPCPDGVECETPDAGSGGGAVDTGSIDQGLLGSDPSIATNPNFSYADAILAAQFSQLAYKHRDGNFKELIDATGWRGIRVPDAMMGPGGFSPEGGGYGVIGTQDGMGVQSYAFAGSRVAGDGTEQFVFAVEGSNSCPLNCLLGYPGPGEEREDWDANARKFGWSRYYASLQPLMAEVLRKMIDVQKSGKKAQLIITGHSLGGAVAMIAYADLLPFPKGDFYPLDQTDVLARGKRIWDKYAEAIGSRTFSLSDVWQAVKNAITVYTFGAPSPLIEWLKLPGGLSASVENIKRDGIGALFNLLVGLPVPVDARWPAAFTDSEMRNRIFQFEHKGEEDYPDDVVAKLGSRDPGYQFEIRLRPDIQEGYAGGYWSAKLPAATHSIGLYNESLIRLVTWDALLANSAPVEGVVGSRTPGGNGVDGRNDVFREMIPNCSSKQECEFIGYTPSQGDSKNNVGRGGNDWYAPALGTSYLVNGGPGSDLYALYKSSIEGVTIDGRSQSGTDAVVFYGGLEGSDIEVKRNQRSGGVAVSYTSKARNSSTTLLIQNYDRWAPSDVFYTKSVDGRMTLARLPNLKIGPVS